MSQGPAARQGASTSTTLRQRIIFFSTADIPGMPQERMGVAPLASSVDVGEFLRSFAHLCLSDAPVFVLSAQVLTTRCRLT